MSRRITTSEQTTYFAGAILAISPSSGVLTANLTSISVVRVTVNQNITSMTISGLVDGQLVTFVFKNTGTYSVTFSSIFRINGGVSAVSGNDTIMDFVYDGSSSLLLARAPPTVVTP